MARGTGLPAEEVDAVLAALRRRSDYEEKIVPLLDGSWKAKGLHNRDESAAEMALANYIARRGGNDWALMWAAIKRADVRRHDEERPEKWRTQADYVARTLAKATEAPVAPGAVEADLPRAALELARSIANIPDPGPAGSAGAARRRELSIQPRVLDEALAAGGFDRKAMLRAWAVRGWIETAVEGGKRRFLVNRRQGGGRRARVVVCKEAALALPRV